MKIDQAMFKRLMQEERFALYERAKLGVKKSERALEQWHRAGLICKADGHKGERVFLDAILEGGQLVTSREAVQRFLAKLNGVELKDDLRPVGPKVN